MGAPGTICRLTVDWAPRAGHDQPYEGDLVRTEAGRAAYHVLEVRRVNSTVHPRRYRLVCARVDPADVTDPDWIVGWHPRKHRP